VFGRLNTTIASTTYDPATGQTLADIGGIIPLQKGPDLDEFFLTFDRINVQTFNRPPPVVPPPVAPADLDPKSEIGVRTFDEINATYAAITGVDPRDPNVQNTYQTVRQSMPTIETAEAFLASHQVAIAQLAIEYCNALINDTALRTSMFPGFPFTSDVATAFPGAGPTEDLLYDPLLNAVLGSALAPIGTQPDIATVKAELDGLVHGVVSATPRPGLAAGGGDAGRTQTIAKSVCAAVLGSGVTLVQ
jgi:hypothetical protein